MRFAQLAQRAAIQRDEMSSARAAFASSRWAPPRWQKRRIAARCVGSCDQLTRIAIEHVARIQERAFTDVEWLRHGD